MNTDLDYLYAYDRRKEDSASFPQPPTSKKNSRIIIAICGIINCCFVFHIFLGRFFEAQSPFSYVTAIGYLGVAFLIAARSLVNIIYYRRDCTNKLPNKLRLPFIVVSCICFLLILLDMIGIN